MNLSFEWTIRFGDILTLCGGAFVAVTLIFGRGRNTGNLEAAMARCLEEISEMKGELSEFGKAMTKLAVQETKIDLLMKWYDELRNGKGIVN
jgi:hypothetical protein